MNKEELEQTIRDCNSKIYELEKLRRISTEKLIALATSFEEKFKVWYEKSEDEYDTLDVRDFEEQCPATYKKVNDWEPRRGSVIDLLEQLEKLDEVAYSENYKADYQFSDEYKIMAKELMDNNCGFVDWDW